LGKYFIYAIVVIFLAPVLYSIVMALKPDVTASMRAVDTNDSVKIDPAKLYQKCAACHGANGDGSEGFPSLNTLGKQALIEKMLAFQSSAGSSSNKAMMKLQLQGMSRDTIESLSAYISTFKPNPKNLEHGKDFKEKKQDLEFDTSNLNS
jgi:cytochrome c553